ncbi:MAG: hypothetical protein RBS29_01260 [Bacteroidales bacterium]|nr:hypothetical protein [Bacteroidales bacterium]
MATNGSNLVYSSSNGNVFQFNMFHPSYNNFGTNPIVNNNYENIPIASFVVDYSIPGISYHNDYHLLTPQNDIGNDRTQVGSYH